MPWSTTPGNGSGWVEQCVTTSAAAMICGTSSRYPVKVTADPTPSSTGRRRRRAAYRRWWRTLELATHDHEVSARERGEDLGTARISTSWPFGSTNFATRTTNWHDRPGRARPPNGSPRSGRDGTPTGSGPGSWITDTFGVSTPWRSEHLLLDRRRDDDDLARETGDDPGQHHPQRGTATTRCLPGRARRRARPRSVPRCRRTHRGSRSRARRDDPLPPDDPREPRALRDRLTGSRT